MFTREGTSIRYINPLEDFGSLLLDVQKPARYTGGEYGRLCEPRFAEPRLDGGTHSALRTLIAFPDLYEIGMSNQALRILYNRLNGMEGIVCDRAFAPAPDFEELLLRKQLPLYGLDTGISLKDVDLLMFTLGYELGITGVFSMLDISHIPLRCSERGEDDPVVIMGGPCVSNPLPYSAFIDAFWIGEAEGGFFELAAELAAVKKSGGGRRALLEKLTAHPSVWAAGKGRALRAVDRDFSVSAAPAVFPVPSMKVVHHHGAVEIMRGCPNGCRFCHAGYWYRPMRQKRADLVEDAVRAFVSIGGYREITLSSLSSGDYQHLDSLIDALNAQFRGKKISFQLPSLKVSSFSLKLLEKISSVRKSGLTFAVETPLDFWQMTLNKRVTGADIDSILLEAKRHGWRGAKFYFMIGLPVGGGGMEGDAPEEEEIAAFVERAAQHNRMRFNINVGTFVPKPHTPFQWAAQISRQDSEEKLNYIRNRLKPQGHKVGIQDPLVSVIEGIASRGDERACAIFEEAYRSGCRLDAWSDYFKKEIWLDLLRKNNVLVEEFLSAKDTAAPLSWECIAPGISGGYFRREEQKSRAGEITSGCIEQCDAPCGTCGDTLKIARNSVQLKESHHEPPPPRNEKKDPDTYRILFSFSKQGSAVFHAHLGLLEIFSMAFIRAGIPNRYTQGFNPLPKLEIASPLSLGIRARGEIAAIDTEGYFSAEEFKQAFNAFLPEGFAVHEAMNVFIPSGSKKYSISSLLWGFVYAGKDGTPETVPLKEEKSYRESSIARNGNILGLERISLLAKKNISFSLDTAGIGSGDSCGESYFKVYRELYPDA